MRILSIQKSSLCLAVLIAGVLGLPQSVARADGFLLAPLTKVRLSVTQWDPGQAEFRRADALNGEFTVGDDGTLSIPLIGRLRVDGMDTERVAAAISGKLKAKIGLLETPDAAIDIIAYPPIYVVGDVTNPGEFQFRPAMSVLKALAASGGFYRQQVTDRPGGQVELVGAQQDLRSDIMRSRGRIARLQAEMAGASEIAFPPELTDATDQNLAAEVIAQEKLIFTSRANGLRRQSENFGELRSLLGSEIEVLGQKSASLDEQTRMAQTEFAGVAALVDRGVATVARRSELQRAMMNLKSDQLDQMTAQMRARQTLTSTVRDAAGLEDRHKVEVSSELRDAQTALEKLTIKLDVVQRQLVLSGPPEPSQRKTFERSPSFEIVRQAGGSETTIAASEETRLMPGDVVKVTLGYTPVAVSYSDEGKSAQLAGR